MNAKEQLNQLLTRVANAQADYESGRNTGLEEIVDDCAETLAAILEAPDAPPATPAPASGERSAMKVAEELAYNVQLIMEKIAPMSKASFVDYATERIEAFTLAAVAEAREQAAMQTFEEWQSRTRVLLGDIDRLKRELASALAAGQREAGRE